MKKIFVGALGALASLFVFAPMAHADVPAISSLSPNCGPASSSVVINGSAFSGPTTVKFGTTATSFTMDSATKITAVVPSGTGTVDVTVVSALYGTSNALPFTYGATGCSAGGTGGGGTTPSKVTVGPGTSIETMNGPLSGGGSWCTVAAVGHDDSGNMVAMTAGHCYAPQSTPHLPVRLSDTVYGTGQQIGTYETLTSYPQGQTMLPVDSKLDYSIIKLDPNVVQLTNVAPNGTVFDHLNLNPPVVGHQMCKYGQVSGYNCGTISDFSNNTIHSDATIIPGDSGGGVIYDGGFAGVNSAINPFANPGSQFTSIIGIMNDLNSRPAGTVGRGFVPQP